MLHLFPSLFVTKMVIMLRHNAHFSALIDEKIFRLLSQSILSPFLIEIGFASHPLQSQLSEANS